MRLSRARPAAGSIISHALLATMSTRNSTVNPCANMIASVQPSALLASNLSARRRSVLDLRVGFDIPDQRADHVGGALLTSRASRHE